MSMQNGSKLDIPSDRILIHALELVTAHLIELKLRPFEVTPCLYREAMHLQCSLPMYYVRVGHINVMTFTQFAQIGVWGAPCKTSERSLSQQDQSLWSHQSMPMQYVPGP